MDSDSRRFDIFLARALEAHRAKLPNTVMDGQHFKNLAMAKWETLTQQQKNTITIQEPSPEIASSVPPSAQGRMSGPVQPRHPVETEPGPGKLNADKAPRGPKQSKKGTSAKMKDPNAPKKPLSAYILFSMDEVKRVRIEDPQLTLPQVTKLVGERWRHLKDKSHYETQAAADRQRYTTEMIFYTPKVPEMIVQPEPKKMKKENTEDFEMPKIHRSAFHLYSMDEIKKLSTAMPDISLVDAMDLVTQRWKYLKNKQEYEDRAAAYNEK